jgi:EmrB/QacA subfamily drug resistance transporter
MLSFTIFLRKQLFCQSLLIILIIFQDEALMEAKQKHGIDTTGRWVLLATISASSMAFLDGSALNVVLTAIQNDLGASAGDLLWIVNAFALCLAALLLVGGSLGDHFGRKRIYRIGIIVFTVASIACGLAPSPLWLIGARALQGIGGALMIPGSLAIVAAYFDDDTRGQAIGIWASVTTLTSLAGPIIGGFFGQAMFWRGIFFINIPLALLALFALRSVPESYDEEAPRHLDFVGAILISLSLAGISYGAISIGELGLEGFGRGDLLGALLAGFVFLVAFLFWEAKSKNPMMPLSLFRSRTFLGTNLLTLSLYGALSGALFFLPLNLLQIQGYQSVEAGFALLSGPILIAVLSPLMGRIVDRFGARLPLVIGPTIVGFGYLALSSQGITAGFSEFWWTFLPGSLLIGLGMGITVAPLTTAVMGSVPQHSTGIASGVNNAMSRSSQVLALAILGGLALLLFSTALAQKIVRLGLSAEAQQTILSSANNLGNTSIPDAVDTAAVRLAIQTAFVEMFRLIMWIGAGMSWLSAIFAAFFVEDQKLSKSSS